MDNKYKELAVKIFNHFFKKAGISELEYFVTFDDKIAFFVHVENIEQKIFPTSMTSFFRSDSIDSSKEISNWIPLDTFPDDIKAATIFACLASKKPLILYFTGATLKSRDIILIPEARSLEELAIKMELEK